MTQTLLTDDFCLRSCWREHHPWILLQLKVAKRYSLLEQKTKQTLLTTLICKLTVSQTVWVDDLSHNKKKQLPKSVCKKTTPPNMWPNTVDNVICLEKQKRRNWQYLLKEKKNVRVMISAQRKKNKLKSSLWWCKTNMWPVDWWFTQGKNKGAVMIFA